MRSMMKFSKTVEAFQQLLVKSYGWQLTLPR
jgi:hypothetical protein